MLESTRRWFREGGLNLNTLHGYIYARWTNSYVRTLIRWARPDAQGANKWLADHYHGKVLSHDHAKALIGLDHDLAPRDLEQIIPYPTARTLVLKGPPDVAAYECACRNAREKSCQPTQVCMVVGQPFVDFILEHHPGTARRLSQQEALDLLEAEHARGHLHSAWFKDAMFGRFYAICNCCKCCCASVGAMRDMGCPMLASSGYVVRVEAERCILCETCAEACLFNALSAGEECSQVDWERCMGCGVCVDQCPQGAITLVRDERKGVPLDVRALASA